MADVTPVEEIRAAVKVLRCGEHSFPIQPPDGSLFFPGPCSHCGLTWDNREAVGDRLKGSLADLLERSADAIDAGGCSSDDVADKLAMVRAVFGRADK